MTIFEKTGPVNTEETLNIALKTATERNLDIVVASSEGDTALSLMQKAKEAGFAGKIVCVSCAYGSKTPGENRFSQERRTTLEQNGIRVVTAAHALSGVELIAYTLRMFGQGTKVCVEVALMALDCGSISYGKPIVAIGGSGRGADTACVLTPGYTANLMETKIHEILCKPSLMTEEPR